jgi:hypothetical protein
LRCAFASGEAGLPGLLCSGADLEGNILDGAGFKKIEEGRSGALGVLKLGLMKRRTRDSTGRGKDLRESREGGFGGGLIRGKVKV